MLFEETPSACGFVQDNAQKRPSKLYFLSMYFLADPRTELFYVEIFSKCH